MKPCDRTAVGRGGRGGGVLTQAGGRLGGLVTPVAVDFGVGVVKERPALFMLHGCAVAAVMDLTASATSRKTN